VLVPAYIAMNVMKECLPNLACIGSWIVLINDLKSKRKNATLGYAYEAIEKDDSTPPCGKRP